MSTLAVTGNALGTGVVTLTSPNTNTNRTIALPDADGSLLASGTAISVTSVTATTVNATNVAYADSTTQSTSGYTGFRNRIINGAMVIDQRNAGASVSVTDGVFTVDRWKMFASQTGKLTAQQNLNAITPPSGFKSYLGVTSLSAYSVTSTDYFGIVQPIEGYNIADLGWGAAGASSVTLSFWVRSSLTGTFGGVLKNTTPRSYAFTYSISSANTWEYKTVTVAGDTAGTWASTNTAGLYVEFGLGAGSTYSGAAGSWAAASYENATGAVSVVGTNAATFYITGVQLEKGSTATPFEFRQYGTELALCQRYYYRLTPGAGGVPFGGGFNASTTRTYGQVFFPVPLRIAPTALEQSGTAADYRIINLLTANLCSSVPAFDAASVLTANVTYTVASGLTAGQGVYVAASNATAYLGWSAEL